MRPRSLRTAALMIVGALAFVQALVTVLEAGARPRAIDPSFVVELEQAQTAAGSRYVSSTPRGR